MSQSNIEVVAYVLTPAGEELDMIDGIEGDFARRLGEHLDDDAEIRFITPDGGGMGDLGTTFRGIDGFVAGWREWLAPWEEFRARTLDMAEGEDGKVVSTSVCEGHMRGSGIRVEQDTALVMKIVDGRIRAIDHYLDHEQARRAAGVGSGS